MTKKKDKKPDILPVDRDTWKKMKHDSMYFVPSKSYDNYDFLKTLSLKNDENKTKKEVKDTCE